MLERMKSKQRSREFWEKAVERSEASGKTRAQCARELGVGAPALSYWIYKLRAERQRSRTSSSRASPCRALVPVRVIDAEPQKGTAIRLRSPSHRCSRRLPNHRHRRNFPHRPPGGSRHTWHTMAGVSGSAGSK